MRIPPYYEKGSWQRFFAGGVFGALISWILFVYMFGVFQDIQIKHISKQALEIEDLKDHIQIWQDDYKKLNEENQKGLTLQEINVKLTNAEDYKFDTFREFQLESVAKKEINHLIAKELNTIYQSQELIIRAIENKVFTIDEKDYRLDVRGIYLLNTNLEIQVMLQFKENNK
ncbi:sporulation membrane protein YtrI [Bacillus sp. DJP31]|uniref:sporulation membrane protein YtrI n=1 Tax=Bacillus sp. DJP31 TaxID=3409789 RepID=UPI003BB675B9